MKKLEAFIALFLFIGIQVVFAQKTQNSDIAGETDEHNATVVEGLQTIKTYPFSDPNPLPAMAISKKVSSYYPYFMIDGYTNNAHNEKWKVVELENDYISVTVLPEVGGKVWGAIEKSTGKEFVYQNHAMKFRAIAIRGPWTSGGIEHNFGLDLGHAPWAASPVDYKMLYNADGSVSCVVGGLDLASRSEWRVKINVPKDKAYFETEALWFNPLSLHEAYLSWEVAAYRGTDDLQLFYPGNYHIGHYGLASPWPIDKEGRDLSYYKNNKFGLSKSYHVMGDYRNWYGGYWHDLSVGFAHWSLYTDSPGKKLWIISIARDGDIWSDLLTDGDGPSVEWQAGVKFNQPMEEGGYHSPFTQLTHNPFYAETKTDYWFPVKDIGGMVDANTYGSLNVDLMGDSLRISICPLQQIEDNLVLRVNDEKILHEKVQLEPMKIYNQSIEYTITGNETITVNLGNKKLYYSNRPESIVSRPVVTSEHIKDYNSASTYFRMGEDQNAMRNYGEAIASYKKCIEIEPTHSVALAKIAELYYRKGQYTEGIPYARKVLEVNTYDGAANFIYGALHHKLGNLYKAEEAYSVASRSMEYRSAAYAQLALIEVKKNDFELAVVFANKSLDFNKYNLTSKSLLISAFRKSGARNKAQIAIEAVLNIDPLNHYARFEKFLLAFDSIGEVDIFQSGIQNEFPHETYLELAIQYVNIGLYDDAIKVLELAPEFPTVYYWLAYLYRDSSRQKSMEYLRKAEAISPWLVFPFRLESIPVLEWAEQQHHSWKTVYYSGLIQWNKHNLIEAKELFEKCADEPDYGPFYISRGILCYDGPAKQESALKDFKKAVLINPGEWRSWHELNRFYEIKGYFSEQFENAKKAYQQFMSNPFISIDYSRALLNAKKPEECIEVLNNTFIFPQEGAREGHDIYEMAHIALALNKIEQRKFKEAILYLDEAKNFPENLGVGKPYDPDYRVLDFLLAHCEEALGNASASLRHYQSINDFSDRPELFNTAVNVSSNYIPVIALKKLGIENQAKEIIEGWKHYQDSLNTWHISKEKMPLQMEWVLAKYYDPLADTKALEDKIIGNGNESQFTLLLRALDLFDRKRRAKL